MPPVVQKLVIRKKEILGVILIAILFVLASYYTKEYKDALVDLMGGGFFGMFLYVIATILAIVFVPISTFPLLAVGAVLWGSVTIALLSIVGWVIGSIIAYILAQKYGRPFVKKFISEERSEMINKVITGRSPFWMVVFLRLILPVDLLSYALGLFAVIPLKTYISATIVGLTPFAFFFAYTANMPTIYQIVAMLFTGVVVWLGYLKIKKLTKEQNSD